MIVGLRAVRVNLIPCRVLLWRRHSPAMWRSPLKSRGKLSSQGEHLVAYEVKPHSLGRGLIKEEGGDGFLHIGS